ncbi:hypothetical protein QFC20_006776 [Naganishia adeliensis]|uniref:Uncharacterized protein n=1 Tax=Naganishia adeliensis TaxID=92952 RepID=A0ACC2V7J0_9TREE|nr:hypothetical protein QFC20_006776 [Naganishia adeliensis]
MGNGNRDNQKHQQSQLLKLSRILQQSHKASPIDALDDNTKQELLALYLKTQAEKAEFNTSSDPRVVPRPSLPTQSAPKSTASVASSSGTKYRIGSGSTGKGKAQIKETVKVGITLGNTGNFVICLGDTQYFRDGEQPFDYRREIARAQMRWLEKEGYMVQIEVFDDFSPGDVLSEVKEKLGNRAPAADFGLAKYENNSSHIWPQLFLFEKIRDVDHLRSWAKNVRCIFIVPVHGLKELHELPKDVRVEELGWREWFEAGKATIKDGGNPRATIETLADTYSIFWAHPPAAMVKCPGCKIKYGSLKIEGHKRVCPKYGAIMGELGQEDSEEDEEDVIDPTLAAILASKPTYMDNDDQAGYGNSASNHSATKEKRAVLRAEQDYEVIKAVGPHFDNGDFGFDRLSGDAERGSEGKAKAPPLLERRAEVDVAVMRIHKKLMESGRDVAELGEIIDGYFSGRLSVNPPSTATNGTASSMPSFSFSTGTFEFSAFGTLVEDEPARTVYGMTDSEFSALPAPQDDEDAALQKALEESALDQALLRDMQDGATDPRSDSSEQASDVGDDRVVSKQKSRPVSGNGDGAKRKRALEDDGRGNSEAVKEPVYEPAGEADSNSDDSD